VLEANVRATQMAFLHNQKTLELGLKMAETLRDSVRVMAESQADWIKSISSARGFFRNASAIPAQPPREPTDDNDDEDADEDDEDTVEPEAHWVDKVMPHVIPLLQVGVPLVVAKLGGTPSPSPSGKPNVPFEWSDLLNWQRAADRRNALTATTEPVPPDPSAVFAALPPSLVAKLMQVKATLTDAEQVRAMQLLSALRLEDLPSIVPHLEPMTVEQIAAFLRAELAKKAA
jgi:hypothetical protein